MMQIFLFILILITAEEKYNSLFIYKMQNVSDNANEIGNENTFKAFYSHYIHECVECYAFTEMSCTKHQTKFETIQRL